MGEQRGRLPGDSGESIGSRLSYGCLHTSKPWSVSRGENMQKRFAFCTVFLLSLAVLTAPVLGQGDKSKRPSPQIGRASCRERVEISTVAVELKKKTRIIVMG